MSRRELGNDPLESITEEKEGEGEGQGEEHTDGQKQPMMKNIEVAIGNFNLCLIDDSLNHDVPLLELRLSQLHADHRLQATKEGSANCLLCIEYYNRSISSWEPIVEPWR